jgi:hypothetical protein
VLVGDPPCGACGCGAAFQWNLFNRLCPRHHPQHQHQQPSLLPIALFNQSSLPILAKASCACLPACLHRCLRLHFNSHLADPAPPPEVSALAVYNDSNRSYGLTLITKVMDLSFQLSIMVGSSCSAVVDSFQWPAWLYNQRVGHAAGHTAGQTTVVSPLHVYNWLVATFARQVQLELHSNSKA